MGSDSRMNDASAFAFSREMVQKKKRGNRAAKLKQCKLDARREQWLSQVKSKGGEDSNRGSLSPSSLDRHDEQSHSLGNLNRRGTGEELVHESDFDSPINSVGSSTSRKDGFRSSSCSGSSGCFSGTVSEDDEGDGSLDDWEAVADALTAGDNHQHLNLETLAGTETMVDSSVPAEHPDSGSNIGVMKLEWKQSISKASTINTSRAWRPDDAFRPQSLPNLSKQFSFPMKSERKCIRGASSIWGCRSMNSQPSACPICCEELDLTDSSFLPCSCGFRLCLFCHKRILEVDGRCPGCRKQYSPVDGQMGVNMGSQPFQSARFCNMSSRS